MKNLTIIIPVHTYDENIGSMLTTAIESYRNADKKNEAVLMVVGPKEVIEQVKKINKAQTVYVENEGTKFSVQINKAVSEVSTDYFSILEFDDTYTEHWFENVEKYINAGKDESFFLPLTEVVDSRNKENGAIGYTNEAVWASSFSDVIGYLDLDCLKDYMQFNLTGGVFKKKDYEEIGGLKESMKLSYWYEFMLRAVHNKKTIFVIPKVGYIHLINRKDSESVNYQNTMTTDEADWWTNLALKEYLFKKDRKKTYEE